MTVAGTQSSLGDDSCLIRPRLEATASKILQCILRQCGIANGSEIHLHIQVLYDGDI